VLAIVVLIFGTRLSRWQRASAPRSRAFGGALSDDKPEQQDPPGSALESQEPDPSSSSRRKDRARLRPVRLCSTSLR